MMPKWLNVLVMLIVAYLVLNLFYSIFKIIKEYWQRHNLKKKFDLFVLDVVRFLGNTILISGKLGSGKSTFAAALMHVLTIYIQSVFQNKIRTFEEAYPVMNYAILQEKVVADFAEERKKCNEAKEPFFVDKFIKKYNEDYSAIFLGKTFFNGTRTVEAIEDFEAYIFALIRLMDPHYVVSKTRIYNHITKNYSLEMPDDYFNLKAAAATGNYYLEMGCIAIVDEAWSEDDLNAKNQFAAKSEDKGSDVTMRLYRQLMEETSFFIFISQEANSAAAEKRGLFNSYILMRGCKVVADYYFLTNMLLKTKAFSSFLMKCKSRFKRKKKRVSYLENTNRFKKVNSWCLRKEKKLFSKAYTAFDFRIYHTAKDLMNQSTNTIEKEFYTEHQEAYPLLFAFGSLDTFNYKFVHEQLKAKHGRRNFFSLEEWNAVMSDSKKEKETDRILTSKNEDIAKQAALNSTDPSGTPGPSDLF